LLKFAPLAGVAIITDGVSVLFNEPKLLKWRMTLSTTIGASSFSALQRAEIAEIIAYLTTPASSSSFSALQRAEIAEILRTSRDLNERTEFQCSSTSRNC